VNVLFYSALPAARHGGVVRWVQKMVATLRDLGHRVHVLTWSMAPGETVALDPDLWGSDLHALQVEPRLYRAPVVRFWGPLLAASRAARHMIEEHDIDVVQCVAVYEARSALRARGSGRAAVVLSVHGDFVSEMAGRLSSRLRRRLYLPAERGAFRGCDAVTTSSAWLRDRLASQISRTRAEIIPNGIDIPPPGARFPGRRELGLPESGPIVLTVNNLYAPYRRTGLELLAAAAPAIVERVPDVLFVVAGGVNEPERDAASLEWAQRLTSGLPFFFTGYRPEPPAGLMAAADLYLHASALDNSPTAVLEAMALGRPVVATSIGGIPELIADDETGLLVPLEAGPLARAAVRLLQDKPLAAQLGAAARRRAQAEFSWLRTGERFTRLYTDLVRSRAGTGGEKT